MGLGDWLFGTCGRNHIGVYVCSRCGYELLRSGFQRGFIKTQSEAIRDILLPVPPTIAARGHQNQIQNGSIVSASDDSGSANELEGKSGVSTVSRTSFNSSMIDDFTKNANLGRLFHKKSLLRTVLGKPNDNEGRTIFEIACGKCGSSLGHQTLSNGHSTFDIKIDKVDLAFRRA